MKNQLHPTLWLGASLGLLASGCTDQPTQADYDDTAQAIGSLSASTTTGELRAFASAQVLARGGVPTGFAVDAAGHATGADLGLSYRLTVECRDSAGALQATCGAATAAASADVAWSGSLALPNLTAMAERTGHVALSGLGTDTATLDGSGALTLDARMQSWLETRTTDLHFGLTSSYQALRFSTSPVRLLSGTIRYTVDAERTVTGRRASDTAFSIDATLTVSETGASLVLDGAHRYDVDLASGRATRR